MAVQEGLEVVGGGGDARALGDLEGELAGADLVDAQAGGDDAARAVEVRCGPFEVGSAFQGRLDDADGRIRRLVAGNAGDPCPGQDGAPIGERVAPGVVVDRSDEDEVGVGYTRGVGAGRDQAGRGSVRAGGLQGELGRPGPSVMRDRQADAAGARLEGGVECLARLGPSRRKACAAKRIREQFGHHHSGVLRGAAAGNDDRLASGGRFDHGASQSRDLGTVGAEERRRGGAAARRSSPPITQGANRRAARGSRRSASGGRHGSSCTSGPGIAPGNDRLGGCRRDHDHEHMQGPRTVVAEEWSASAKKTTLCWT